MALFVWNKAIYRARNAVKKFSERRKMYEDLHDLICSVVQDHLAEWGTTAKVVGHGEEEMPLRDLLNGLCSPLINELHEEVSNFYKEKESK